MITPRQLLSFSIGTQRNVRAPTDLDKGHYAGIALNIGLVRPHIDNVSDLLRIVYAR